MLRLIQFLLYITVAWCACGPQQTIQNEGRRRCCYYDSKRIPTIGIGYNLRRADASDVMTTYNLSLPNVLKDCRKETNRSCLTDSQADDIFNRISYPEAASCVDRYVPGLPTTKRAAIIDVAFAGCRTLNKFKKMKAALEKQDWQKAGDELRSSAWCTQVRENRCNAAYKCIVGTSKISFLFESLLILWCFSESCTGGVCGTFTPGCLSSSTCYCFQMTNGTGFCSENFSCASYSHCTSCPSSSSVCLVNTCCGVPKCVPLSLGASCKSGPSSRMSSLVGQHSPKLSNGKTATKPWTLLSFYRRSLILNDPKLALLRFLSMHPFQSRIQQLTKTN